MEPIGNRTRRRSNKTEAPPAPTTAFPTIFREYDRLIAKYGELPAVGPEIKAHVVKLRHQPEYAAILNEPAAAELWKLGEKYEHDDHVCCAYWTYKKGIGTSPPAPSAVLARDRFADLAQESGGRGLGRDLPGTEVVPPGLSAGGSLAGGKSREGERLFAEIVSRRPTDSEVYRAAKRKIQ